jgi:dTDP-4-dehydrorhamnose reductase
MANNKILIAGAGGQLGREFRLQLEDSGLDFSAPEESELDITKPEAVEKVIQETKPTVILNCAAYNAVDKAEDEADLALRVNGAAVENLAQLCKKHTIFLVHYGTDYVFDGKKEDFYVEEDPTSPINKYGETKLAGEEAVKKHLTNYLILRLSWVIGRGTQNFLYKLHGWAKDGDILKISADEVSVPTYTEDVVDVTLLALEKHLKGLYHMTNSGYCSRYELARYFLRKMDMRNLVIPVSLESFDTKAKRPAFSAMSNAKISKALDISIPKWEYGVDRFAEIFKQELVSHT